MTVAAGDKSGSVDVVCRGNETPPFAGAGSLILIIAANWKMNPPLAEAARLVSAYAVETFDGVTRVLFPPAPYIVQMGVRLAGTGVLIGGQDCHKNASGAHTGDISASMLADCGATLRCSGIPSAGRIIAKVTSWSGRRRWRRRRRVFR